jgi:hypothetical protein
MNAVGYRIGLCYRSGLIVIAAMCLGLGTAVLAPIRTGDIQWARLGSLGAPMPGAAAFGVFFGGLALLGISLRFPLAAVCGAVSAASIGLASVYGCLTGGVGVFEGLVGFTRLYMGIDVGQHLAPNTAVCLLLSGAALLLRYVLAWKRYCFMLTSLLGSAVLSIGMMAYVGYLVRFPTYCWILSAPMSFLSSIGCILLGLGVLLVSWRYSELDSSGVPRWFPALMGISMAVMALCIARACTIAGLPGAGRVRVIGLATAAGTMLLPVFGRAARKFAIVRRGLRRLGTPRYGSGQPGSRILGIARKPATAPAPLMHIQQTMGPTPSGTTGRVEIDTSILNSTYESGDCQAPHLSPE